jgi:hypothetical protein
MACKHPGYLSCIPVAATGRAADQLVLGEVFILDNPGPEQLRTRRGDRRRARRPATIVGDPTLPGSAGGAILTLIANGAHPARRTSYCHRGPTAGASHSGG